MTALILASLFCVFLGLIAYSVHALRKIPGEADTSNRLRLKIESYTGFGTPNEYSIAGRVSKDGGRLSSINAEFDRMGITTRVRRNLRRFLLPDIQGVGLEIQIAGTRRETTTGPYGHFKVRFKDGPFLQTGYTTYSVRLHEKETRYEALRSVGQILVPNAEAHVGIISDIDDTIVASHIKNKFRMVFHTILTNVSDLQPTPGFPALLTAASLGKSGQDTNPVFYVSGSPANLHDKLHAFLRANRFPIGPIFLTNIGLNPESGFFKQRIFKTERIRDLFLRFPQLKFVLIGDNTQVDHEIYQQMALEFPGRVAASLIYERIPRHAAGKILPLGQHRITNAFDAGFLLYKKGLISKESLQTIVNELIVADLLPESFNLDRKIRQLENRQGRRFTLFS